MKVLVLGSNGQVGQCFKKLESQNTNKEFFFFSRSELSITDSEKLREKISKIQPDFIINCAAYTKVDQAETDKERCESINCDAVKTLSDIVKEFNSFLVHFSTDYVFDGTKGTPYNEADFCKPINFYGESKFRGEEAIRESGCAYFIFRTSWVYSEFSHNFLKTVLRLCSERDELNIVSDQFGSPTNANDLAEAVLEILDKENLHKKCGVYHFTNEGKTSWLHFAQEINKIWDLKTEIKPIKTEDYPTDAKRPLYSVLNKEKITSTMEITLKPWKESLKGLKNEF